MVANASPFLVGPMLASLGSMRILVYGAGNIGSPYAGLLSHAGHEVSILARGERLATIREVGIELEDCAIAMARRSHGSSKQAANSARPRLSL